MKILIGNNAMGNPGGSETHAYTLIKELTDRGYQVSCITKRTGMVSKEVEKLGVKVFSKPIEGRYDLALLSHSTSIALSRNVKAFKVQTCHGIYPTLEQPVKGMDNYVGISEEVCLHLHGMRYASNLIRNGIDCERFKPVKPINKKLKTILSLSHSDEINNVLSRVCRNLNINLIINNKYKQPIWNIEEKINQTDLIVSLGRGVYESMACGRNVLVLDNRGYVARGGIGDGMMTKAKYQKLVRNNCSGRALGITYNYEDIICELFNYSQENGQELREIALKEHNIKIQVDKYLALVR